MTDLDPETLCRHIKKYVVIPRESIESVPVNQAPPYSFRTCAGSSDTAVFIQYQCTSSSDTAIFIQYLYQWFKHCCIHSVPVPVVQTLLYSFSACTSSSDIAVFIQYMNQ